MASTIDLRTETVGAIPSSGIRSHSVLKARIDASKVSGGLVSGNTYKYLTIPEKFIVHKVHIRVVSADLAAGTTTLTDGSIVPLAAQVVNAAGMFYGTTNLPKYFDTGGYLAGLIATADITTAIFDVIVEGIDLRE